MKLVKLALLGLLAQGVYAQDYEELEERTVFVNEEEQTAVHILLNAGGFDVFEFNMETQEMNQVFYGMSCGKTETQYYCQRRVSVGPRLHLLVFNLQEDGLWNGMGVSRRPGGHSDGGQDVLGSWEGYELVGMEPQPEPSYGY